MFQSEQIRWCLIQLVCFAMEQLKYRHFWPVEVLIFPNWNVVTSKCKLECESIHVSDSGSFTLAFALQGTENSTESHCCSGQLGITSVSRLPKFIFPEKRFSSNVRRAHFLLELYIQQISERVIVMCLTGLSLTPVIYSTSFNLVLPWCPAYDQPLLRGHQIVCPPPEGTDAAGES